MSRSSHRLPDAELEVMKAVWQSNTPISTSNLKAVLDRERPWNVSALQTLLNRLITRGFLRSEKRGKCRYYEPLVQEDAYLAAENKAFLKRLNHGSVSRLVASLYDSKAISDQDLEELAAFIAQKTKEGT